MNRSTPIAVSTWMSCLCPCQPGVRSWKKIQPKQRCLMLCSRHRDHASALPQRSRRGWVSRLGQFKAWAPRAATTSPGTASASRGGRGSLWLTRASPISTGVGPPIPTLGDDPDEILSCLREPFVLLCGL